MSSISQISIIIPCLNEEKFIAKCLDSIINNDYPMENLEVLVIDGMSEDKTKQIVDEYIRRYPFIKILDNPTKITPVALNIGIKHAGGNVIIRMDAHANYEKDYISKCVKYLIEFGADDVGVAMKTIPRDDTLIGNAIVAAISNLFGVGASRFRVGSTEPKWVDTVPYGCYKREVFDRIGLFNEKLIRTQDLEFNARLRKARGKILLIPDSSFDYYARARYRDYFKYHFKTGFWIIYGPAIIGTFYLSLRHLAPFAFVSSLIGCAILSLVHPVFLWLLIFLAGLYSLANLFSSFILAVRNKKPLYFFLVPVAFISCHVFYGVGSIFGLFRILFLKDFWRNLATAFEKKGNKKKSYSIS